MRYLLDAMTSLAAEKFVLMAGPRQVGKTTLARAWLARSHGRYLNWDIPTDRRQILQGQFLDPTPPALVLDEIHKYPRWRNWLKGLYDRPDRTFQVVVTGSARLDYYRRGGDSLIGRYELLRLHPLTVGELVHGKVVGPPRNWLEVGNPGDHEASWARLERRSGFPEPYYRDDTRHHSRWSTRRRSLLIREDLRDLTRVREVGLVEHLSYLLPERVGSLLSVNALREELEVGHDTVSAWLDIFDRLYLCYRLPAFTRRLGRALKKDRKLYLWDWSEIPAPAARFENMVAGHLLKAVHAWTDLGFGEFELCYLRDKEKREVDFVITERRRPVVLIECKLADQELDPSLLHYREVLDGIPAIQLVRSPGVDRTGRGVRVVTASRFLAGLI